MIISRLRPRKVALIVNVAKALALGLVLVVLVSEFGHRTPVRDQHPSALRLDLASKDLRRAMVTHDCTTTGFGDSASPRSALIRLRGQVRHVSFDHAWSVFTGERPGELLAVCLSDVSVGERPVTAGA